MTKRKAPGDCKRPGRHTVDPGGERTERKQITMPPRHWRTARRLGKGNVSAGVRRALDEADK